MKTIENMKRLLADKIPGVNFSVDPPQDPSGAWFVDVHIEGQSFVVEYRPRLGFGLSSTASDGYGEGPDEHCESESEVVDRIVNLVSNKITERYVVKILSPMYTIVRDGHRDPECNHYSSEDSAYTQLASSLMLDSGSIWEKWPLDTDEEVDRYYLVESRLARWLKWRDSRIEETSDKAKE